MVIFAAIAAALVKVAFFADTTPVADPARPTGSIAEPQLAVAKGTIKNEVTLKAIVSADPATPVKATLAGEVRKILVTQGQHVDAATPVLVIRQEIPNEDGTTGSKTVTVVAGSAGTLSSLPVIQGQIVAVGDAVGQVAPPTFSVTGTLAAAEQYRLLNQPKDAQVAIKGGPAPFTCTGLTITASLSGAGSSTTGHDSGAGTGSGSGDSGSSGGTTVRCAVPAEVTVFPGLAAQLTIAGGVASDVLVVPITAVEGTAETGNVYLVKADGTNAKTAVTLGLNDGENVEVKTGIKAGDQVLQFVPGAPAADPNNGACGDGNPCRG